MRPRLRLPDLPQPLQALAWMAASGIVFAILNTVLRVISLQLDPLQVQFLRYFAGLLVMTPFIARVGLRAYSPNGLVGQLWRGVIHTAGMVLWYMALPHLTLADTTAIGFTGPIFVMIGAVLALILAMLLSAGSAGLVGFSLSVALLALLAWGWSLFCRRLVDGQTGDLIGALQALLEIAALAAFLMFV